MLASSWQAARILGDGLLQLVYPNVCWVCQQPHAQWRDGVCAACEQALTHDPAATCPRCASTVGPYVNLDAGCVHCKDQSFAFDRALRLGPYENLLRTTILRMKAASGIDLAEVIGAVWARSLAGRMERLQPAAIVPVPLHWTRLWQRGFNQSEVMARALGRRIGVPCRPAWLRRTRRTAPQTRQTPAQRRVNVHNAFAACAGLDLTGQTVVLVDDVLTTGATAHEAARALRRARPSQIVVAVLAHAR